MQKVKNKNTIIVSVCMVTYNHERWISNAIEGVLLQKTSFPIELIIADDCSTDDTVIVIEKYQSKYPNIIKLLKNDKNLGLGGNFSNALNYCHGEYIAICEGDDFWTDENKLEIQVTQLLANEELVLCCHNTTNWNTDTNTKVYSYKFNENFYFDQNIFLTSWITQPLTVMFKNIIDDYKLLYRDGIFCDVILFYELLKYGGGYFYKKDMSVFRVHSNALSSGLNELDWNKNHILMYNNILKYNKDDFRLKKLISSYHIKLLVLALNGNFNFKTLGVSNSLIDCVKNDYSFLNSLTTIFLRFPYYFIKYRLKLINSDFSLRSKL